MDNPTIGSRSDKNVVPARPVFAAVDVQHRQEYRTTRKYMCQHVHFGSLVCHAEPSACGTYGTFDGATSAKQGAVVKL